MLGNCRTQASKRQLEYSVMTGMLVATTGTHRGAIPNPALEVRSERKSLGVHAGVECWRVINEQECGEFALGRGNPHTKPGRHDKALCSENYK